MSDASDDGAVDAGADAACVTDGGCGCELVPTTVCYPAQPHQYRCRLDDPMPLPDCTNSGQLYALPYNHGLCCP